MRTACTLLTQTTGTLALQGSCPAFVFANAGGRGYYVPSYHGDLLARLKKNRSELSTAEYASVLYDLRPLVRSGAVDAGEALEWVRLGARSRDRHVIVAAIELASFVRDKLVADADRSHLASFVRRTFGPRARALGFVPHGAESDDDQLLRRTLLRFAAPGDTELAVEARRLALAWIHDRTAIDPGLVDVVLWIAARTGDATLLDAMRREALATPNRLDRRNLMIALFSFAEPALANRGLELLLDPAVDIREAVTALGSARDVGPPNPAIVDFIAANFEALAARVDSDKPGGWPHNAARRCDARDRTALDALWKPRVDRYAGAERNLAQALEAIERCGELRAREAPRARAFLARY
jgi:alanyl aminopeptidase